MQMIQGSSDGRYPVNLYFDAKSGLLARMVRYDESPVGLNPTQVDYATIATSPACECPIA